MPDKPARILEISSYPPPRSGWGVRVEFVKRRVEELGHDCVVLNMGPARCDPSPEYECVFGGFDYLRKVLLYSARGYTTHAHINGDTPKGLLLTLIAQFASLLFFRRVVLTFHAGVEQIHFPRERSGKLLPAFWLMFKLSRRIICNSEAVRSKIVEYGVRPDKVVPIQAFTRQYLDFEEVEFPDEVEAFLRDRSPVVFSYMKLREGFYFETFLECLAILKDRLPNAGFLLVGTTKEDDDLEQRLRSRMDSLGISARICEVPDMSHDEFRTAMNRAGIYLRTPTTDGVCSSVLEALCYGTPVVAAENGTRPESVVTYRADDPRDMAEKVVATVSDLDAARRAIVPPEIPDTLDDEVRVLVEAAGGSLPDDGEQRLAESTPSQAACGHG